MKKVELSEFDKLAYLAIRKNVSEFIQSGAKIFDGEGLLLDIAPQNHEGAAAYFKKMQVYTLDIDPATKPTYVGDITKKNMIIADNYFNVVVCTEVLEHTLQPFAAVEEIYRMLRPGGVMLASTPFNFRIHGPLPDCWRFTEHGLRALLTKFSSVVINELPTSSRDLMPLHYTVIAIK